MNEYRFDDEKHVHLLDGSPLIGTSSMASVLAKGGLTYWASGLACAKFGWTNKGNAKIGWIPKAKRLANAISHRLKISKLSDEEYLSLLDEAYSAHATKLKDSAVDGTDMHAIMEEYVKVCINQFDGKPCFIDEPNPKLKILIDWAMKNVKRFIWSEVNCYSRKLWLGGISDVGYEDMEGKYVILDFKSSKEVYLSQFWQCIGYAIQLEENGGFTPEGVKVLSLDKPISYVAILPFGMEKPEVQYNYDMEGGVEAVKSMLTLYKKLNN
jgi:hypothetical protein